MTNEDKNAGGALDWNAIKRVAYRTLKQFPMDSEERHIAAEAIASGVAALTPKADAPEPIEGLGEPDLAFIDGPEQGKFYPILKFDSKEHCAAWMNAARSYRAPQDVAKIAEGLKVWNDVFKNIRKTPRESTAYFLTYEEVEAIGDALAAALSGKGGV